MKSKNKILLSFHLLKEVVHTSPTRLWLEGLSILASVSDSVVIWVIAVKLILDAVVAGDFRRAVAIVGLAALGQLLAQGFGSWMENCYRRRDNIRIHRHFHERLYHSAVDVDLRCYDNPEYFEKFIVTIQNSDKMALQCIQTVNSFFTTVLTALLSGGLIVSTLDEVLWIVLPCTLAHIFFNGKRAVVRGEMSVAQAPYEKKQEYLKRLFFLKRTALDMRTTRLPERLSDMFRECQEESLRTFGPYVSRRVALEFLGGVAFYGQLVAVLALLYWRAMVIGDISVGGMSMLIASAQMLMGNLRFIGDILGDLTEQSIFAEKYLSFLEMAKQDRKRHGKGQLPGKSDGKGQISDGLDEKERQWFRPNGKRQSVGESERQGGFGALQVEDVSFGYEGKPGVFSNLSLAVHKGQKVALVGPNGAGKSTLVNLILNLYEPDQGTICYNDVDIRGLEPAGYRARYSLVFQDCQLYPFSIAENLLFRAMDGTEDEEKVWDVLERVGLAEKVRQLPLGIETPVTKEFDSRGVVFSGGGSQRLVLARAFLQDGSFFIMDEPTSALDPKQELSLNRLFAGELRDKTLILISHRLSTITGVDYIYLINEGKVEEDGTHEELMERQGHYARIYKAQADLYALE